MSAYRLSPLRAGRPAEDAFSGFPSTVAVLAAEITGSPHGLVASTFTAGVSFDPALALVSVRRDSRTWAALREARGVGVSLLGTGQEHLVGRLASRERSARFRGVSYERRSNGDLLLDGAAFHLSTTVAEEIDAGDHRLVLLRVDEVARQPGIAPLLYSDRRLSAVPSRERVTA